MEYLQKLIPGQFYHIYNRGNNKENIFREKENYHFFLKRYYSYITPIADTYAYGLIKNHFHFSVRIKLEEEIRSFIKNLSESEKYNFKLTEIEKALSTENEFDYPRPFSNFFNSYSKSFNKKYVRTGSLFESRFGRSRISSNMKLMHVIYYIHYNPQWHKFVKDFREWPFTSWHDFYSDKISIVERQKVINLFGSKEAFKEFHEEYEIADFKKIETLVEEISV